MNPSLSIIIPTHKRANVLKKTLEYIEAQTIAHDLEVIVVSDGHDAHTSALFIGEQWTIPVHFFEIPKSQQGVARNRGVEKAKGEITLFIGDDIFLLPDACEKHVEAHRKFASSPSPVAVLGFTTWDPDLGITPVMRWLEQSGWQFGYPLLRKHTHAFVPEHEQHRFMYTSHLSLPTKLAKEIGFHEGVTLYGWEDIEWGVRHRKAGLKLYYEPDAKALHHHKITLDQSLNRMKTLGESLHHISKINPEINMTPTGLKHAAYKIAALLPTMGGKHRKAFLEGLQVSKEKNPL